MRIRTVFCLAMVVMGINTEADVFGSNEANEIDSVSGRIATLEKQSLGATNLEGKREAAQALGILLTQLFKEEERLITNKFTLAAIACESHSRYLKAVLSTNNIASFATSGSASNAIAVLQLSLQTLSNAPAPASAFINVMPPSSVTGLTASGMSPKGIQDPKARAEYERRIANNGKAIEEANSLKRLRFAVADMKNSLKIVYRRLVEGGQSASMRDLVKGSQIPQDVRAEILNEEK